jgi:glycosyltransferase involved in cell wall biosynthesis
MRIALITEGTYPVHTGGVSTWCDQLLQEMPEHDWTVIGLTATGSDRPIWPRPRSVRSVVLHPLWGVQPSPARRPWRGPDPRATVQTALLSLYDAALAPDGDEAIGQAEAALRLLVELSHGTRIASLLAGPGSTAALLTAWQTRCPDTIPMSVAEAVAASVIIDRTLGAIDAPVGDVDVLHAAGNGAAALVALAAHWRNGTPIVLSEHGVYLRERYLALDESDFSWPERRAVTAVIRRICEVTYRQAARVVPVSDFNSRWAQRLGVDPLRVLTVRNGVRPDLFQPVADEPDVPTLTFVGRIDPLKDLHTLVRAFALVRAELPTARLRLFGPTPEGNEAYRTSVVDLVRDLGLTDAATFEGPSVGSRPAIAAGNVVVLSSISEGLPFTVIEAMMCGRATVSTDVGGVAECLAPDGSTGVVVPARDPRAFADACLALLTDDDRRRAMGEAARRHALEHATLDRAVGLYRDLYRAVHAPAPLDVVRHEDAVVMANVVLPQQRTAAPEAGTTLAGATR